MTTGKQSTEYYVLITGCRWMDLPKEYGPKSTVHDRLKDWEKLGVWKKVMDAAVSQGYREGKLSIDKVAIDSTDVSAKKGEKIQDTMEWKQARFRLKDTCSRQRRKISSN